MDSLVSAQAQDHFATADTDGDGKLSAAEFTAGMAAKAPAGASGDTTEMAASLAQTTDTDSGGLASSSELGAAKPKGGHHGGTGGMGGAGGAPSAKSADSTDSTTDPASDPADTDGDGVVTSSELLAYIQGTGSNASSSLSTNAGSLMKDFLTQLGNLGSSSSSSTTSSVMA